MGDCHAREQAGEATDCSRRDKPPWLLGEVMGQIERLEKSKLHSQRMHGCWLAKNQGSPALPHFPV